MDEQTDKIQTIAAGCTAVFAKLAALATIVLGIAVLAGAPFTLWWLLVPAAAFGAPFLLVSILGLMTVEK